MTNSNSVLLAWLLMGACSSPTNPCGVEITGSCFEKALPGEMDQCTDYTATDLSSWKRNCINSAASYGTWSDKPCQTHFMGGCQIGTVGQAGCAVTWVNLKVDSGALACSTTGGTPVSP